MAEEYINFDPAIARSLSPTNTSIPDQGGEGGEYNTVTLQEANPTIEQDESIRFWAEGGHARGLGPISEIAKVGMSVGDQFMGGGNLGHDMWQYVQRKLGGGERDPLFNHEDFVKQHAKEINPEQAWRWYGARNETEAMQMLADDKDQQNRQRILAERGWGYGLTGGLIAGLVDVDMPITLAATVFGGGAGAGMKVAATTTRLARVLKATTSAAATGAAFGAAQYQFNTTSTTDDITAAMLFSGAFGFGVSSVFSGAAPDRIKQATADEWAESRVTPASTGDSPVGAPRQPFAASPAEATVEPEGFGGDSSLGARSLDSKFTGDLNSIASTESKQIIADATQWSKRIGNESIDDFNDPQAANGNPIMQGLVKGGDMLSRMANRLGIGNDFARMYNSDNPVWKWLAWSTAEDATGKAGRRHSAAVIQEDYKKQLGAKFSRVQQYETQFGLRMGLSQVDMKLGRGDFSREFGKLVQLELDNRRYGRPSTSDQLIKDAADAKADFWELELKLAQGQNGEIGIESYKGIAADRTYKPQRVSGRNAEDFIEEATLKGFGKFPPGQKARNAARRALYKSLVEDYRVNHPNMHPKVALRAAKTVIDYALSNRGTVSRNLTTLLVSSDADTVIRDLLIRNGIGMKDVEGALDTVFANRAEKTAPSQTKNVTEVDFGGVSSFGIKNIDLFDNDIMTQMQRRMSSTAGQAALARNGIDSRVKFEAIVKAGMEYDKARGKKIQGSGSRRTASTGLEQAADAVDDFLDEKPLMGDLDEDFFEAMYANFAGIAPKGGASDPMFSRIRKFTGLTLLNQMGLTQLAEFGPTAALAGWERFIQHSKLDVQSWGKNGKTTPLMDEMKHMSIFVTEEGYNNPRFNHEMERQSQDGDMGRSADKLLNAGQMAQGHISGFYGLRGMQQRVAVTSATSRIFESIKNGDGQLSPQRLSDMGFENVEIFDKYVKNGTVEFDADGNLKQLHLEKWDFDDIQYYRYGMTRTVNQLIQKALYGESSVLFHRDGLASLFWQLKSFPMLALDKQFNRNLRLADTESAYTFAYGMVFAGLAYSTKAALNGQFQNLTPDRVARGALNLSNMTGWLPMWTDPVMGMLGMSDYSLSGFGSQGAGPISTPAAFTVLQRFSQLPGALGATIGSKIWGGEYTVDDVNSLQTASIFGNMLGLSLIFNDAKYHAQRNFKVDTGSRAEKDARDRAREEAKANPVKQAEELILPQ